MCIIINTKFYTYIIMKEEHFFSGATPNLINKNALETINKILNNNINQEIPTGEHLFQIYNEYIKPNLFALLIIIIISLFLFIRYVIKQHNENKEQNLNEDIEEISNIDNEIKKSHKNKKKKTKNKNINNENITDSIDDEYNNQENDFNFDSDDNSECKSRFEELNEEYNKAVIENAGIMSEEMIKDIYKKKKDKYSFNELTKIIVEGGRS